MRIAHRIVLAAFLTGTVAAGTASAQLLIDDFSSVGNPVPWPVTVNTLSSVNVLEVNLSNVIGGSRYSTIRATYLENLGLDFVQAAIVPNFGMLLDYSSTAGARGDWNLLYDNDGNGLNIDFSQQNNILLDFGRFDFANGEPLPVTLTLSDGVNFAELTRSLTAPGAQIMNFATADFSNIGLLDFAHLQSINVFLEPGLAADFRLSSIYAVPTPGSIALLSLGTLAFAGRRRMRYSSN